MKHYSANFRVFFLFNARQCEYNNVLRLIKSFWQQPHRGAQLAFYFVSYHRQRRYFFTYHKTKAAFFGIIFQYFAYQKIIFNTSTVFKYDVKIFFFGKPMGFRQHLDEFSISNYQFSINN